LAALGFQAPEFLDLACAHGCVVDLQDVDRRLIRGAEGVHADDLLMTGIDAGLRSRRGLLDLQLRNARLDGLRHAAQLLDLLDVSPGLLRQFIGEALDIVGATPRVDDARGAAFLL
jgi:hypothetical protein